MAHDAFDCRELEAVLSPALDGELEAARARALEGHLASCAACRARFEAERAFDVALRARLQRAEPAPASVAAAVRAAIGAGSPATPWYARALASPWTPRLAMAAVLVAILLVPALRLASRTPAVAHAAALRHGCHHLTAVGPLPPCCKDVAAGVGTVLGEPSPGFRIPDLGFAGLVLERVTLCTFESRALHLARYRDAAGAAFSLYATRLDPPNFRLMRTAFVDGVVQVRHAVPIDDPAHGVHATYDVTLWRAGDLTWTWVGPEASAAYEAALGPLRNGSLQK